MADPALTHRRVLDIALPIVLSNATVPILGIVDTGVVGQMGEAAGLPSTHPNNTAVRACHTSCTQP